MAYCLEAFDAFFLTKPKLTHFLETHLDYTNMHQVYYAYKISELLDLGIEFNAELIQALVQDLYCPEYHEFYRTTEKERIDPRIFYYICDIAKFSRLNMNMDYPSTVLLGDTFSLSVEFGNLIVADYGDYTTVRFESEQLGIRSLEKLDNNTYGASDIFVPAETSNFPEIEGNISIYEGVTLRASFPIRIDTNYTHAFTTFAQEINKGIRISVEGSNVFASGIEPLYTSEIYALIRRNGVQTNTIYFTREDKTEVSAFTLEYEFPQGGEYEFSLYLEDPFQEAPILFDSVEYSYLRSVPEGGRVPDTSPLEFAMAIPLSIGCMAAPLGMVGYTSREKLKAFLKKLREFTFK
jgi:hypothetical protein